MNRFCCLTVADMKKLIAGQPDETPFAVIDNFGNAVLMSTTDAHLDWPMDRTRTLVEYAHKRTDGTEPNVRVIVLTPPTVENLD